MKVKNLLIILLITFVFLLYNLMCYNYINKQIYIGTKEIVTNTLKDENYRYLKATNNSDGTLNVYVKYDNVKYHFVVSRYNNIYSYLSVDKNIPNYIK